MEVFSDNVKNYLIKILLIVIISTIIYLIVPKGKTENSIKFVLTILIIYTIFSPIFNIKNINLDQFINEIDVENSIDYSYLNFTYDVKKNILENEYENFLKKSNYDSNVKIDYDVLDNKQEILHISVTVKNIDKESEKNKIVNEIISLLVDNFNVKNEIIKVDFI